MKLTADGERLFEYTAKTFRDNADFLMTFLNKSDELQREIKIMTTPAVGETEITHFLLPFLEKHPKIRIRITTQIENIDVHKADVAIRTYIPQQIDIEQLPLRTFHMKLWASQEYLNSFGMPKTARDLDNHRLLAFEENKHNTYSNTNWILHVGRDLEPPREPYYQITSNEGLHNAAVKGYGIVHLPIEYVRLKGAQLVEVLPELEVPKVEVYFIYSKRFSLPDDFLNA